jgi:hypothetical protein
MLYKDLPGVLQHKPFSKETDEIKLKSGEDRFDVYLVIESIDSNGDTFNRFKRKVRCKDLIKFIEGVSFVYDSNHPEDINDKWQSEIYHR